MASLWVRCACLRSLHLQHQHQRQLPAARRTLQHLMRYLSTTATLRTLRKYTEKHEWVSLDGKVGTVGITHYAQEALGDIVYAQLPEVGSEFNAMDECGALESVKAASELYCPLTGKIVDKNAAVEDKASLINTACYTDGWLFKIELSKPDEFTALMEEAQYEKYIKTQSDS